jgi:hypothetical protein
MRGLIMVRAEGLMGVRAGIAALLAVSSPLTGKPQEISTAAEKPQEPTAAPRASVDAVLSDRLFKVFKETCEEGSGHLKPDEASPLPRRGVPLELQEWWKRTKKVTFYKLESPSPSYLVVFEGLGRDDFYVGGCALATKVYNFRDLFAAAAGQRMDKMHLEKGAVLTKLSYDVPQLKYTIESQSIDGDYNILQVSLFNDKYAKRQEREFGKIRDRYLKSHASTVSPVPQVQHP